jgi:hypothetical protein
VSQHLRLDFPERTLFMKRLELMHLNGKSHGGKEPAVTLIASHPAALKLKDLFYQALHRLDGSRSLFQVLAVLFEAHGSDHSPSLSGFVHLSPADRHQRHAALSLELSKERIIIGFGVHDNGLEGFGVRAGLKPQALGFVGRVSHPEKAPKHRNLVRSKAEGPMAVDPTIARGSGPRCFLVNAPDSVGDDPLLSVSCVTLAPSPGSSSYQRLRRVVVSS